VPPVERVSAGVIERNEHHVDEWLIAVELSEVPPARWAALWAELWGEVKEASNRIVLLSDAARITFSAKREDIAAHVRHVDTLIAAVNKRYVTYAEQAAVYEAADRARAELERAEKQEIQSELDRL
jgi:hypothetical protein